MRLTRNALTAALAVLLALALALPNELLAERTRLKPGFNLFSRDQDVEIGHEASQQVEKEVKLLNDARVDNYIQHLGARLAAKSLDPRYPYTFRVVNSSQINAFALPGGPIYINRGIIENADNEAQVAGVMAHEITHVALRHGTNQLSKAMPAQLLGQILAGAIGGGVGGQLAQLGIGLGINSVLLKYSRDAERQADLGGVQILYDTGYNPHAMAQFFEKIKQQSGGKGMPEFFSSHPDPGNREKAVEDELRRMSRQREFTSDSADFREIKRHVESLPKAPTGETPTQAPGRGANQPPDPPARVATLHRGSSFEIRFPENWRAFPDRDGNGVLLAPERGVFQDNRGQNQIAYGTMINLFRPQSRGGRLSLKEATAQLIQQIQTENPVRIVNGSERQLRVNGKPALSYQLSGPSPMGGNERDRLVTVQRDTQTLLFLIFIAPENELSRYSSTFDQMLSSLRLASR